MGGFTGKQMVQGFFVPSSSQALIGPSCLTGACLWVDAIDIRTRVRAVDASGQLLGLL